MPEKQGPKNTTESMVKLHMPKFKYIAKGKMDEDWVNLLSAADSDFVSVTILLHFDIQRSSALWLTCHSIEKYLKCLLNKNNSEINLKKYNHNLLKLRQAVGNVYQREDIFQNDKWLEFVRELNIDGDNPSLRYSGGYYIEEPTFSRAYTLLSTYLRLIILGSDEYNKRDFYGIDSYVISPDKLNNGLGTVLVSPLTSTIINYSFRSNCIISGKNGSIALDQIRCVDKSRLDNKKGKLKQTEINELKATLHEMLIK